MRNIRTAFAEFFGQFWNRSSLLPAPVPIPAFQSGYVVFRDAQGRPMAPAMPYLTYDLVKPNFMDFTIMNASVWDRNTSNPGFFGLVDDVLSQIAEKIPEHGIILDVGEDGALWLSRSNPFIGYMAESAEGTSIVDSTIMRGMARIMVRNYTI